jgi:ribonuclease E
LLYSEPDLTIRVVRDIFNEDFTKLVIASDGDWDMVDEYIRYVAPNLAERLERWTDDDDVFEAYRIDEQIAKALERKVWLPSGGSLVIDATEAMTVIDVNTGKFTGQGGNLEQTVTRNNLEAAEEIVRQLRVRDVGGIIVIDFIDMVLESNRDLVLRRLLECLARDRTKHQVAEVTSLGLVQMTRKRVGSGLLEAFSVPCEHCNGRGVIMSLEPVDHVPAGDRHRDGGGRDGGGRDGGGRDGGRDGGGRDGGRGGSSRGGRSRGSSGAANGGSASGGAAPGGAVSSGAANGPSGDSAETGQAANQGGEPANGSARGDASDSGAPADVAGSDGTGSRHASGGRRRRRTSEARAASDARTTPDVPASSDAPGVSEVPGGSEVAGSDAHSTADALAGSDGTSVGESQATGEASSDSQASAPGDAGGSSSRDAGVDVPIGVPEAAQTYIHEPPAGDQDPDGAQVRNGAVQDGAGTQSAEAGTAGPGPDGEAGPDETREAQTTAG